MNPHRRNSPHWVYRGYDADGRLLYVGCTMNPEARLKTWASGVIYSWRTGDENWFRQASSIHWQEYPDHWAASKVERDTILAERPPFNVYFNPDFSKAAAARVARLVVA